MSKYTGAIFNRFPLAEFEFGEQFEYQTKEGTNRFLFTEQNERDSELISNFKMGIKGKNSSLQENVN